MMAIFSQTSTTGSVVGLSLLMIVSMYFLFLDFKEGLISWSSTQVVYAVFIIFCIISTLVNIKNYQNDYSNIGKMRYFIFALILSFAFRNLYRREFFSTKRVKILATTLLASLTFVTITSFIGSYYKYNFWKMKSFGDDRLAGAVTVGNYGLELPVLTLIFLALIINYKKISHVINKKFLIICTVINIVAVYYSGMRSALLGFIIALPFLFYFINKKKFIKIAIISGVSIFIIVFLTFSQVIKSRQFMQVDNPSNNMRISMWKKSIEAFKEKPLLGHGYLSRNDQYLAADSNGVESIPLHIAHSSYFQILKDMGILGIISFLCLLGFWFRNYTSQDNLISRICLASFVCALFHGGPHNFLVNGSNSGMLLAVLYAMSEINFNRMQTKDDLKNL